MGILCVLFLVNIIYIIHQKINFEFDVVLKFESWYGVLVPGLIFVVEFGEFQDLKDLLKPLLDHLIVDAGRINFSTIIQLLEDVIEILKFIVVRAQEPPQ